MDKSKMNFKVLKITGPTLSDVVSRMEEAVNNHLEEGYRPVGGSNIIEPKSGGDWTIVQSIFKRGTCQI